MAFGVSEKDTRAKSLTSERLENIIRSLEVLTVWTLFSFLSVFPSISFIYFSSFIGEEKS